MTPEQGREFDRAAYQALGMLAMLVEFGYMPQHHVQQVISILATADAQDGGKRAVACKTGQAFNHEELV